VIDRHAGFLIADLAKNVPMKDTFQIGIQVEVFDSQMRDCSDKRPFPRDSLLIRNWNRKWHCTILPVPLMESR
jgi:hypothetical protein